MTISLKKLVPTLAITLACSLGAFGIGVSTNQSSTTPVTESGSSIAALTTSGDTVQLTSSQKRTFDDNTEPLDPSDATYEENVDLTPVEVEERSVEVGESYDIGEPVSLEDLEFLRIYAFSAEDAPSQPIVASARISDGALAGPAVASDGPTIQLVDQTSNTPFNVSTTQYGTTANIAGSARITIGDTFTNSWSVSWTAKRISGAVTTKISSKANIYGYAAVAAWPYVGLVTETHPSASTTTSQSLGFSRNGYMTAFLVYMTVECHSTFYNASGSFQI